MSKNIQVAIKVRPLLKREKEQKLATSWKVFDNSIQLADSQTEPFSFDHIFDQDVCNQNIFDKMAKHIVHSVVRGFNGTIFAYGQTSSGKTYTMLGDEKNPGVMVLAAKEIFREIEHSSDRLFLLRVGYIEIYNEKIYDLLNKKNTDLKIHETPSGNASVNCEEFIVTCEDELLHYLCEGNKERTVGETNMNEHSSRSHAIFRIIIESRKVDRSEDDSVNQSVLNLVDLAGSERADQTGARGARLKEGAHINKSLHFLSNVIKLLSENSDSDKYISFRDSKLTRILQASLGGNALTSIICTIKPTAIEETQSTLNFAMRAKSIKNKPHVNEVVSEAAMMKRLEREINLLKSQLAEERSKNKSQIKVGQLEQRLKTEVVKIISCNSLNNLKHHKDKRRRTWCPAYSKVDVSMAPPPPPPPPLPSHLPTTSESNPFDSTKLRTTGLPIPIMFPPTDVTTKLQLHKYFTPQISLRSHFVEYELFEDPIKESMFESAERLDLNRLSPTTDNSQQSPKSVKNLSTTSITPKVASNVHTKLKIVENALVELQEFTNLENKLDIRYDNYDALKQRLELAQSRNAVLEAERLEYIELKDDHAATKNNLNDCLKRCSEFEDQIKELSVLHRNANEKISNYEKQIEELNEKIKQLDMENREAVSLDYEFEQHKNKSKQRETELLEVLSEKNKEITKLERSLSALAEEKLTNSKEGELMQVSRRCRESVVVGTGAVAADDESRQICVKCADLTRLLNENQKMQCDFERLTSEYEKLQQNFNKTTDDANEAQMKLSAFEQMHNDDVAQCDRLRNEISTIRGKLEQVQSDYAGLSGDYQKKTAAYEELHQQIDMERTKMEQLQEKYEQLESTWQLQQRAINDINLEYDVIQQKYESLQIEYEKLEHTSAAALSDCEELHMKNESLQTEISELKRRVEQAQSQLLEQQQQQEEQQEQERSEDGEEQKRTGMDATLHTQELKELRQNNVELQTAYNDLKEQFAEMQKEYDDLSNQLMDQLQDGELLKEQNNKLEAQLAAMLRKDEQQTDTIKQLSRKSNVTTINKEAKQQQSFMVDAPTNKSSVKNEEILLSTRANATPSPTNEHRRDSITTLGCVSESMRSSGVGLDDVESSSSSSSSPQSKQLLLQFAKLAPELDEIELEYEAGQSRCFYSNRRKTLSDKAGPTVALSYRMIIKDIEKISSYKNVSGGDYDADDNDDDDNNDDDFSDNCKRSDRAQSRLCMRGSLARNSFRILEIYRTALARRDAKVTKKLIEQGDGDAGGDNLCDQTLQEDCSEELAQLREENQELQSFLASMRQVINEMRDQIMKLSAELMEKSLFVEKCECSIYRKPIEELHKERLEMTSICEELQMKAANASDIRLLKEALKEGLFCKSDTEEDWHRSRYSLDNHKRAESTLINSARQSLCSEEEKENYKIGEKEERISEEEEENHAYDFAKTSMSLSLCLSHIKEEEDNNTSQQLSETLQGTDNYSTSDEDIIKELRTEVKKLNEDIEKLQKTLEMEQHQLKTKVLEFEELNRKCENIEEQFVALKMEHEKEMQSKQLDIERQQKEHKSDIDQLQLQLCETLERSETAGRESLRKSRELEEQSINYERAIAELQSKLKIETEQLNKLSATAKKYDEAKLLAMEAEKQLQQTQQSLDEGELEAKSAQITQMQHRLEKLLEENNILTVANFKLKEEREQFEQQLKEIQQTSGTGKNILEQKDGEDGENAFEIAVEDATVRLKKDLEELQLKVNAANREIVTKDEKLRASEINLKNLQMDKTKLCAECETLRQAKVQLECKLEKCNAERETLDCAKEQLECEKTALSKELEHCKQKETKQDEVVKELQQKLESCNKMSADNTRLQQKIDSMQENANEREQQLTKTLNEQLSKLETLTTEHEKLQQNIEVLERKHNDTLKQLQEEKTELQQKLKLQKLQNNEALEKIETLNAKIEALQQELHDAKRNTTNYEKMLIEYYDVSGALEKANEEKNANVRELQQLREELNECQAAINAAKDDNKVQKASQAKLEQQLTDAKASVVASVEKEAKLRFELSEMQSQLDADRKQMQHDKREMQNAFEELQIKWRTLQQRNEQLQKTAVSAEEHFRLAQQRMTECAELRTQLGTLQLEKEELQTQLTVTLEEAGQCSRTLRDDVARHRQLLEQQVEAYNRLRALLDNKEVTFKEEKNKLEGTIECLLSKIKELEERIYVAETALKKFENLMHKQKGCEGLDYSENEQKSPTSPRSRKSLERLFGENRKLQVVNLNIEDKLMSVQNKSLHYDSTERKNRRLSTHDERRRQSLWGSVRDASTITDPTDANCKCVELDRKLKECERNLFIRESQVTALNMEIKGNPLKSENIALKRRLQEEQEKHSIELKKHKKLIAEQKEKIANALLLKENVIAEKTAAPPQPPTSTTTPTTTPTSTTTTSTKTANTETQTDSDLESMLRKLESKYEDIKNICRFRHTLIRRLEEQVSDLSKPTETQSSKSTVQLSSLEEGQIKALKQQCVSLKKESLHYKKSYEDARTILNNRLAEIQSLRAQLNIERN